MEWGQLIVICITLLLSVIIYGHYWVTNTTVECEYKYGHKNIDKYKNDEDD